MGEVVRRISARRAASRAERDARETNKSHPKRQHAQSRLKKRPFRHRSDARGGTDVVREPTTTTARTLASEDPRNETVVVTDVPRARAAAAVAAGREFAHALCGVAHVARLVLASSDDALLLPLPEAEGGAAAADGFDEVGAWYDVA